MGFQNVLAFTSCTIFVLAFLMYRPLPEVVDEPWIFRLQGFACDMIGTSSWIASKISRWSQPAALRSLMSVPFKTDHQNYPELQVTDLTFDGVSVRMYRPKTLTGPAPCVVYLHGGGWILFNIDDFDTTTTKLALGTGMVVVSVDYRLAPENPFPTPFDDCLKAVRCLLKNADKFGVDKNRIAVAGDSAGGNLATVVAQVLAKEDPEKISPLKLQVLIYPVTQLINFKTSSYVLYKNNLILNRRLMTIYAASYFDLEWSDKNLAVLQANQHLSAPARHPAYSRYFKEEYMPKYVRPNPDRGIVDGSEEGVGMEIAEKVKSLALDPRVSPLLSEDQDLAFLPPTYLVSAEFDVLRDDGLLYAERLRQAGVEVELSYYKGQPHGFMAPLAPTSIVSFGFKGALKEWENIYTYLKRNL